MMALLIGMHASYLYTEVDVAQRGHGLDLVQPVQVALKLAGLTTHDIRLIISGRFWKASQAPVNRSTAFLS